LDRIMAVLKADAYGHGVSTVAGVCVREGVRHFGVATVDEGVSLRTKVPADSSIYIIAPSVPEDASRLIENRLIPLIGDMEVALALNREAAARGCYGVVHLEVDTGMGRSGASPKGLPTLLTRLRALENLRVTGLSTHFARADEDFDDAVAQEELFSELLSGLEYGANDLLVHIHNSPASLVVPPRERHGLIRCGLSLYGIEPAPGMFAGAAIDLRPVLSLKAKVLLCRALPAGATVSYGKTYTVPPGGGVYATIGIGYGDGYPRSLSNKGSAIIRGECVPICGRVCMDQLVVDVSALPEVHVGDVATLIGTDGDESLRAADIAALVSATPHEITTCLMPRLPRVVLEAG
jgi:alanine racemase